MEEEEEAEGDERDSAHDLDGGVAVADPAERRHRAPEGEAGGEERGAETEGVRGEQQGTAQHGPRVAREHEHGGQHRSDARSFALGESAAAERARAAPARPSPPGSTPETAER